MPSLAESTPVTELQPLAANPTIVERQMHPIEQWLRYGGAGVVATIVDVIVFYGLGLFVFRCVQPDDTVLVLVANLQEWIAGVMPLFGNDFFHAISHPNVQPVSDALRERNFVIVRMIVFVVSNYAAYILNRMFVFQPGRHTAGREMAMFYTVSIVSFTLGTVVGWGLIATIGASTSIAYLSTMLSSVVINFVGRKRYVFAG